MQLSQLTCYICTCQAIFWPQNMVNTKLICGIVQLNFIIWTRKKKLIKHFRISLQTHTTLSLEFCHWQNSGQIWPERWRREFWWTKISLGRNCIQPKYRRKERMDSRLVIKNRSLSRQASTLSLAYLYPKINTPDHHTWLQTFSQLRKKWTPKKEFTKNVNYLRRRIMRDKKKTKSDVSRWPRLVTFPWFVRHRVRLAEIQSASRSVEGGGRGRKRTLS